eukprot:TRINITY_DN1722_c0_g1_i2.p1 TRINITY_DN1722_c0_g1~~TRINITY_DN1722_c0_g1_i2.p1  ORF type:complete len:560 (-),score=65.77 TRINITY_DN1722_c0_g1_i2:5203-6840(-)
MYGQMISQSQGGVPASHFPQALLAEHPTTVILDDPTQQQYEQPDPDPIILNPMCIVMQRLLRGLLTICEVKHPDAHKLQQLRKESANQQQQQKAKQQQQEYPNPNDISASKFSSESENLDSEDEKGHDQNDDSLTEENTQNKQNQDQHQTMMLSLQHSRDVSVIDLVLTSELEKAAGSGIQVEEGKKTNIFALGEVENSFQFDVVEPTPFVKSPKRTSTKTSVPQHTQAYYEITRSLSNRKNRSARYRESVSPWNHLDKGTLSQVFQLLLDSKDAMSLMSCREVNRKWRSVIDQVIVSNSTTTDRDLKLDELEDLVDSVNNPLNMLDLRGHTVVGNGNLLIDRDLILCNGKIQLHGCVIVEGQNVVLKDLRIQREFASREISKQGSYVGAKANDQFKEIQQVHFNSVEGGEVWLMHNVQITENRFTGVVCTADESIEEYPLLVINQCKFEPNEGQLALENKCCLLNRCRVRIVGTEFEGRKALVVKGGHDEKKLGLIKVQNCNIEKVGMKFNHADGAYYTLINGDAIGPILNPGLKRMPSQPRAH